MQIIATGTVTDETGAIHRDWPVESLVAKGIAPAAWGPNAKAWAMASVAIVANGYRSRLSRAETYGADVTPERVGSWQRKAALASGDRTAIPAALEALLEREATAKGRTLDELLDVIEAKADAFDEAALLIDALQSEAEAAITALPIDGDLPQSLATLLGVLDDEATTAFADLQKGS